MDSLAPKRRARRRAARPCTLPDGENFDGEVSFEPPFISFDHLVGAGEELVWHGQPEQPGRLGIDDQLELARLYDRQVRRLGALEDAAGIDARLTKRIRDVGSVAHQPTDFGVVT